MNANNVPLNWKAWRRIACAMAVWIAVTSGSSAQVALQNPHQPGAPPVAPQSTVLSVSHVAGDNGTTVEAAISAAPANGILGIDLLVSYDPAVVQPVGVTVAGLAATASFGIASNTNTPGLVAISLYATVDALTGSGEVARIQFLVVGNPGDTSTVTITNAAVNEGDISATLVAGSVTVTPVGIVLVLPNATGDPGATVDVPLSALHADGALGITTTIVYDPAVIQAQAVFVSGIAVPAGFQVVANLTTPGVMQISLYSALDPLTGSGEIAKIRFHVVGAPSSSTPLTFTAWSVNEDEIQATVANGSFTVNPTGALLYLPLDAVGGTGSTVQVPVSVFPGDGIFSVDTTIAYDPAVIQAQAVTVTGIGAAAGFAVIANTGTPGVIGISTYATNAELSGSGEFLSIQFHVSGPPNSTSPLTFTDASINEGEIPASFHHGLFTVTCVGAPDGSPCDDLNPCTQTDTCHVGACLGSNPVVCSDADACNAGVCDSMTGMCTQVPRPNGTPCSDGNACTTSDTCNGGSCVGGAAPNCNDGNACTADSCNPSTGCVYMPITCDDGLYCNGVEICSPVNGCQAGTAPNCNDGVACTIDACDEATDSCTHTANNAACDDGLYCNGAETCSPVNGCQAGTAPNCNDGVACTIDACDESTDSCTHTASNAACDDGLYCNGAETCSSINGCQAGTAPNCNDGVACTVDACDEATDSCTHTANNAACDDGLYCNGPETCSPVNGCQTGTAPNCNDGVACTIDACDESTDSCTHTASNAACDDGLYCNGAETCSPVNGCQAGTAPNCNDGVACTIDACDEATDSCTHTANNAACDDGLYCNGAETCSPVNGCQTGTAPNCNDGVACTIDACDESTDSCTHTASNAACDDGLYCNGAETCSPVNGCQAGTAPNCNDGVACTVDACDEATDSCTHTANNAACDDGLYCNGAETCSPINGCQAGTAPNCDDGVACTIDACEESTDSCTHTANNAACDDGLYCNGAETCSPVNGCQAGTAPNCNDGVACTIDACDEANDSCTHAANDGACTDGLYCNGAETCDPVNGCQAGTAPNCDDGVACTIDACVESTDSCSHTASNAACDDGLYCNGAETCSPVNGCQAGTATNCDDGIACTIDACDESTDSCTHTANNAACDDGLYCNGAETCSTVNGCQAGTAPSCDDGVACTIDACVESTDSCSHTANNAACDDGLYCNGAETCSTVNGCQAGTAPSCDDGVACTIDACVESTDSCSHTASNAACDDGLYCNGAETCSTVNGCQAGTAPSCDDGVACTIDACVESTDSCSHTASNAACDDGLYCNGAETCSTVNGCQAGTAPSCDDGVACTIDACVESTDSCSHTASNAACDDGLYCNGAETCSPVNGCQAGTATNCNDGVACTIDACDEASDSCTHAANNGACDDGDACTLDVCNPIAGCGHLLNDSDGDGVCDVTDCAPSDPGAFAPPGEVTGLEYRVDKLTLSWNPQAASSGTGTTYDIVRGGLGQFPTGSPTDSCLGNDMQPRHYVDTTVPAPSAGYWYLVRAQNACGTATYGHRSNGTERVISACP